MISVKKFRVTVGDLTNNGVVCSSPTIILLDSGCAHLVCIDEENGIYEVQIADDCTDQCFDFLVQCEECHTCPPVEITKCICEDSSQCDPCQDCIDGICVDRCGDGEFCSDNGVCVGCLDNTDCPGELECINGECSCPPGSTQSGDRCIECSTNSDCDVCEVCQDGKCIEQDCGSGACDPDTGECVDCINEDQCRDDQICVDNECVCPPGFVERDGVCVPAPECVSAEDCDECEVCRNGQCVPRQCPPGQVCVGEYGCVPKCDCNDQTSCDDITTFCYQDPNSGLCGCIPCQGDCTNGCADPCLCSETLNQCINNNCEGPCSNGLDCGDGCGCLDGQCVPCQTLDCTTTDCGDALGCNCSGGACIETNPPCEGLPCSTENDCGEGCTCVGGVCVSCSNFSCENTDCANQPGCACLNGSCVGDVDEQDCTDTLLLVKDDASCTLEATLTKDNCCACPNLILGVRGRLGASTDTTQTMNFLAELRKGIFTGSGFTSFPRLDDFSNENIAENEPPIAGAVTMSYTVTKDVYDVVSGVRIFNSTTTTPAVTQTPSFSALGDTAELTYTATLPKIGSEEFVGTQVEVVTSVNVNFDLTTNLNFPNECTYSGSRVATHVIEDYGVFTTSYGNTQAENIQSDDCRLPLFKWSKSDTTSFSAAPFRKIYVDGSGTYVDEISTTEEGLESCRYFKVESDCDCASNPVDYIVFCNPEDLDFRLSECNTQLEILSFSTCSPNENKQFFVKAGSINQTFTGNSAPVGTVFTSTSQIETVEFGLTCDQQDVCTKVYNVANTTLTPLYETECDVAGENFVITFNANSNVPGCLLDRVEIGGTSYSSGVGINLPIGTYQGTAYWTCGCLPTQFEFTQDCCDVGFGDISKDCETGVTCVPNAGVTYTVNGVEINDICAYVNALTPEESAVILATRPGCGTESFSIPSVASTCCVNFAVNITNLSDTSFQVEVLNSVGTLLVASSAGVVTNPSPGIYQVTGVTVGVEYTITVTDDICGEYTYTHTIPDPYPPCVITAGLSVDSECNLVATSDQSPCDCLVGSHQISIDGIVDLGTDIQVDYTSTLVGFDSSPVAGQFLANGVAEATIEGSFSKIFEKPITVTSKCQPAQITVSRITPLAAESKLAVKVAIGGVVVGDNPQYGDITLTINGELTSYVSPNFLTGLLYNTTDTLSLRMRFKDTSDGTYYLIDFDFVSDTTPKVFVSDYCEIDEEGGTVDLDLRLLNLGLEDGCTYQAVSHVFTINMVGDVINSAPTQNLVLTPVNPQNRKVKYTWSKDGSEIYTDWQYSDSTLPDNPGFYEQGALYEVDVECPECTDGSDSITLCCPITNISFDLNRDEILNCAITVSDAVVSGYSSDTGLYNLSVLVIYQDLAPGEDLIVSVLGEDTTFIPASSSGTENLVLSGIFTTATPDVDVKVTSSLDPLCTNTLVAAYSEPALPTPWYYLGNSNPTFATANDACAGYSGSRGYYKEKTSGDPSIQVGDVIFDTPTLAPGQETNGSGNWVALKLDGLGDGARVVRIDASGVVLEVIPGGLTPCP